MGQTQTEPEGEETQERTQDARSPARVSVPRSEQGSEESGGGEREREKGGLRPEVRRKEERRREGGVTREEKREGRMTTTNERRRRRLKEVERQAELLEGDHAHVTAAMTSRLQQPPRQQRQMLRHHLPAESALESLPSTSSRPSDNLLTTSTSDRLQKDRHPGPTSTRPSPPPRRPRSPLISPTFPQPPSYPSLPPYPAQGTPSSSPSMLFLSPLPAEATNSGAFAAPCGGCQKMLPLPDGEVNLSLVRCKECRSPLAMMM